ncbi:MAG: hypothetical protein ACTSU4_15120, partial [Promethearchaeota archaeon]
MLITHSIIPSLIVSLLGIIFLYPALILAGFCLFLHVFIDTFDWGTNFFFFPKKIWGLKFLISKEEFLNFKRLIAQYNHPAAFFDFKYYANKTCLAIEIIIFIGMVFSLFLFARQYLYFILFYFLFLLFHL